MVNGLTPWNARGTQLLDSFRREMDQLFDRLGTAEASEVSQFFAPQTNLAETDSNYEVTLDLPGMKPEDFEIEMKEGQLWISGQRKQEQEETTKTFHRIERQYGQFRRVISLGPDVDTENIQAHYKDGVLTVTVPKTAAARPKKIQVQ